MIEEIKLAVGLLGGSKRLSQQLGVSVPTVSNWISGKRPIPPKRCVQIEQLTNGAVTRKDLRPHDWREIWIELADKEPAENSGSLKD